MAHIHIKEFFGCSFSTMAHTFHSGHPLRSNYIPLHPFSKIGVQFNHDLNKRDHRNNDRCVRTYVAIHSYPVFTDQLLSANSSGGSSLTSITLSIGNLPILPISSLSLVSSRLLPLSLDRSLPESDNETLSLLLDIPNSFRKDDKGGEEDIRQL